MELFGLFNASPILFIVVLFVMGAVVGSFLNVVVYRLPIIMQNQWVASSREILGLPAEDKPIFNLIAPNSTCPKCGHKIKPLENIPIISYLVLGGRCSACKTKISVIYPMIELATGLITALIAWYFGVSYLTCALVVLSWSLIAMSLIDIKHQILPDNIVLPMLWLGLIINQFNIFTDPSSALIGAIAGYMSLWLVYWIFKLITGKDGIGYGDFKMLAMFGAWGGWQLLPLIILLSSVVGAILGIIILKSRKLDCETTTIPFGPYLAIAGLIALIWGDRIIYSYASWIGAI